MILEFVILMSCWFTLLAVVALCFTVYGHHKKIKALEAAQPSEPLLKLASLQCEQLMKTLPDDEHRAALAAVKQLCDTMLGNFHPYDKSLSTMWNKTGEL